VDLLRTLYRSGELAAADEQYLADRHGWFAQLALTHDASADDARRQQVLASARRTAGTLLAVIGVGLVALLAGLILLILAGVRLLGGKFRCAYVKPASWRAGPFGESFALYLDVYILLSLAMALLFGGEPSSSIWPHAALILILPTALAWLRFRGVGSDEAAAGLGWHKGRGVVREAFAGVAGYLAGLPVVALGMLVSMWIMKHTGEQAAHPIVNHPIDRPVEAWGVFVLACVVAPILEETMFRGALFHHLRGKLGFVFSALISSLIFAAIHPQGWAAVPVLGAIALVLTAIRQWRGSLIGCVVAHSLNNSIVTLILLVGMR
jgi:membrane protease YdiL (CAAX protease family)